MSWLKSHPFKNHTLYCFRLRSLVTISLTCCRLPSTHSPHSFHNHVNSNSFDWYFPPHNTWNGSVFLTKSRSILNYLPFLLSVYLFPLNSLWFPKAQSIYDDTESSITHKLLWHLDMATFCFENIGQAVETYFSEIWTVLSHENICSWFQTALCQCWALNLRQQK